MSLTYMLEDWETYSRDCKELWKEHYDSVAHQRDKMPMQPNEETYRKLYAAGMLTIMVARQGKRMAGYATWFVRPHLHHGDVPCAFEDSYYLGQEWKHGLAAAVRLRALIHASLQVMKRQGVKKVYWTTKNQKSILAVLESLGFEPCDLVCSLWLGG